ncbi:hypothetical protein Tco_1016743 [Tanacetum coccineum]|uniref:Uncharacterized protein n=1 Tax=Tanacetum coccineum TaxID=301880 RepID=A0ABQ5FPJ9_9ASTR
MSTLPPGRRHFRLAEGSTGLPLGVRICRPAGPRFTHPYTAKTIAQFFLDHIYRLYGLLKSIVSDRDKFKKCLSPNTTMGSFPECDAQGLIDVEPAKLLDRKMVKQQNRMGVFSLIQWSNETKDNVT